MSASRPLDREVFLEAIRRALVAGRLDAARLLKARLEIASGHPGTAVRLVLPEGRSLDDTSVDDLVVLAEAREAQGATAAAAEALARARARDPDDPDLGLRTLLAHLATGEMEAVERLLDDPELASEPAARGARAVWLALEKRPREAAIVAEVALSEAEAFRTEEEERRDLAPALVARAAIARDRGEESAAREAFREAFAADDGHPLALAILRRGRPPLVDGPVWCVVADARESGRAVRCLVLAATEEEARAQVASLPWPETLEPVDSEPTGDLRTEAPGVLSARSEAWPGAFTGAGASREVDAPPGSAASSEPRGAHEAPSTGGEPKPWRLAPFLKFVRAVGSGGEAKVRVQGGEVRVNGTVETRRGRRLAIGDEVTIAGDTWIVPPPARN